MSTISQLVNPIRFADLDNPMLRRFAPVIVAFAAKCAEYEDAIHDGIVAVLEAMAEGCPAKETFEVWMTRKIMAAVIGNNRREVEYGVPESLDAMVGGEDEDDGYELAFADMDTEEAAALDGDLANLLISWQENTQRFITEPPQNYVKDGDPNTAPWLFKVPRPTREPGQAFMLLAEDEQEDAALFDERTNLDDAAGADDFPHWWADLSEDDPNGLWAGAKTHLLHGEVIHVQHYRVNVGDGADSTPDAEDWDEDLRKDARSLGLRQDELLDNELDAFTQGFARPSSQVLHKALEAFCSSVMDQGERYWQKAKYIRAVIRSILNGLGKDAADHLAYKVAFGLNRKLLAPAKSIRKIGGSIALVLTNGVIIQLDEHAHKLWDVIQPKESQAVKDFTAILRRAAEGNKNVARLCSLMEQLR